MALVPIIPYFKPFYNLNFFIRTAICNFFAGVIHLSQGVTPWRIKLYVAQASRMQHMKSKAQKHRWDDNLRLVPAPR